MGESDEVIYSRFLAKRNEDDLRVLLERHRESLTLFLGSFVRIGFRTTQTVVEVDGCEGSRIGLVHSQKQGGAVGTAAEADKKRGFKAVAF